MMRRISQIVGSGLLAIGLVILAYDASFFVRYGMDATDVAAISDGDIIDWPTGERPVWALAPAFAYALVSWILATAVFAVCCRARRDYSGRIWRGTE